MKVLFVCKFNVGRSQTAMEFYNQLRPGGADSAGTLVDEPGQKLKERFRADAIITAMKELGIDMTENVRKQIVPEALDRYDQIIVMAEPETVPEWLEKSDKAVFWKIQDARDVPLEGTRKIRDEIKAKVEKFVENTR